MKFIDLILEILKIFRISRENDTVDREIQDDMNLADRIEDHNEDKTIEQVDSDLTKYTRPD